MIAHKQIEAGGIGVTCAKLGEAGIFLESGIKDILIANEIVGDKKIQGLLNLSGYGNLIVCVDHLGNARDISEAAGTLGRRVDVLVEVDVDLNRCGVRPGKPALDLVKEIAKLKYLVFRGLMGYEGGGIYQGPRGEKEKMQGTQSTAGGDEGAHRKKRFPRGNRDSRRVEYV